LESSTFNIDDLVEDKGPNFNPSNPMVDESSLEPFSERHPLPLLPDTSPNTTENIDKILDDEIIFTRDGGTRRHLVCWKGKSPAEDTWLDHSEL